MFILGLTTILFIRWILIETSFPYVHLMVLCFGLLFIGTNFDYGYLLGWRYNKPDVEYNQHVYSFLEENFPENWEVTDKRYFVIWDEEQYWGYHIKHQIEKGPFTYFLTLNNGIHSETLQNIRKMGISESKLSKYNYIVLMGDYEKELTDLQILKKASKEGDYLYRID